MYSGRCVSKLVFQANFFQDTLSRKDAHRVKLGLWSYLEGSYRWPHNFFITNLYIPVRWGAKTSRNHFSSYPRREDVVDLMHSAYTSKVAISGIASLELGVADGDSDVTGWDNGLSPMRVQGGRCVGDMFSVFSRFGWRMQKEWRMSCGTYSSCCSCCCWWPLNSGKKEKKCA